MHLDDTAREPAGRFGRCFLGARLTSISESQSSIAVCRHTFCLPYEVGRRRGADELCLADDIPERVRVATVDDVVVRLVCGLISCMP